MGSIGLEGTQIRDLWVCWDRVSGLLGGFLLHVVQAADVSLLTGGWFVLTAMLCGPTEG